MPARTRRGLWSVTGLMFAAMMCVGPVLAQTKTPENAERAEAMKLAGEHKMIEALPLLERLYQANPADVPVAEAFVQALVTQYPTLAPAEGPKTLVRAREILVKLDRDGVNLSDLSKYYLTYIPADGKPPTFSDRKEVDEAMREGEAEFARRAFDRARAHYMRAFTLDPKNEEAALFVGDTYFAANNPKEAANWFARAAQINPQNTAAWRYWGDALGRLGKQTDARDKFCEAVLTAPYTLPPWMSLRQWARSNKIAMVHPRVLPEDLTPQTDRQPRVEDGTIHVALYSQRRGDWKANRFSQTFPKEEKYRHSLAEEADALHSVAQAVAADKAAGKIKTLDPDLELLLKTDSAGLLEAYVLLARPDEGIAQDFTTYRANHADKLLSYLKTYFVPLDGNTK